MATITPLEGGESQPTALTDPPSMQTTLTFSEEIPPLRRDAQSGLAYCAGCGFGGRCEQCAKRRAAVAELAAGGVDAATIAKRCGLPQAWVSRYLEDLADLQATETVAVKVPNAYLRGLYERALARDPELDADLIASRAGISDPTHLVRLLGLRRQSRSIKNGRVYEGTFRSHIALGDAERIAIAIGETPSEIDFDADPSELTGR